MSRHLGSVAIVGGEVRLRLSGPSVDLRRYHRVGKGFKRLGAPLLIPRDGVPALVAALQAVDRETPAVTS